MGARHPKPPPPSEVRLMIDAPKAFREAKERAHVLFMEDKTYIFAQISQLEREMAMLNGPTNEIVADLKALLELCTDRHDHERVRGEVRRIRTQVNARLEYVICASLENQVQRLER